jgi:glycosyltransferase involved in cell wall biosynthesis
VLPGSPIYTIGHGTNPPENQPVFSSIDPLDRVQILTAGGFVPHKNQHTALEAAHLLKEKGRSFTWHMVGPIRHKGYYQFLQQRLQEYDLQDQVYLEGEVPFSRLQDLYRDSNLYVQPSLEEGFCMTALDAAKYGLPIIGTPAGAIPEIIQMSGGILTESQASSLAEAIHHWMQIAPQYSTTAEAYSAMLSHFTWENAARQLDQLYHAKRP